MEIIQQICEELVNPVVAIKVDAFFTWLKSLASPGKSLSVKH